MTPREMSQSGLDRENNQRDDVNQEADDDTNAPSDPDAMQTHQDELKQAGRDAQR